MRLLVAVTHKGCLNVRGWMPDLSENEAPVAKTTWPPNTERNPLGLLGNHFL